MTQVWHASTTSIVIYMHACKNISDKPNKHLTSQLEGVMVILLPLQHGTVAIEILYNAIY